MKNIYADALAVQDACNLSGIVHSWAESMSAIWEEERECHGGTDFVNRHPVNILFASKVADLTGAEREGGLVFSRAMKECEDKAG